MTITANNSPTPTPYSGALTRPGRLAAGVAMLATIGITAGGNYVLEISNGGLERTEFQLLYARAGHGHAGALVTLGLAGIALTDLAGLRGWRAHVGRWAIPASAVLMPAGFFLSSAQAGATEPNDLDALIGVGAASLIVGLVTLGGSLTWQGIRRRP